MVPGETPGRGALNPGKHRATAAPRLAPGGCCTLGAEVSDVTTSIAALVPALKRELAVPGTFAAVFPDTTDTDLTGALADGFAEAQLFGFFKSLSLTESNGDWTISEDLSAAGSALVVIYASIRAIRAQLRNLKTMQRYKAGPVEFETQQAATVLTAELGYLKDRLADIIKNAEGSSRASAGLATVFDNYLARNAQRSSWGGFYGYEFSMTGLPIDCWK